MKSLGYILGTGTLLVSLILSIQLDLPFIFPAVIVALTGALLAFIFDQDGIPWPILTGGAAAITWLALIMTGTWTGDSVLLFGEGLLIFAGPSMNYSDNSPGQPPPAGNTSTVPGCTTAPRPTCSSPPPRRN